MAKPCPFCRDAPALQTSKRVGPQWFSLKCVSVKCADRIVETHRFATQQAAERAWDDRVGE